MSSRALNSHQLRHVLRQALEDPSSPAYSFLFRSPVTGILCRSISQTTSQSQAQPQKKTPSERQASLFAEPFLTGTSATYIDDMQEAWKQNPASVHASWDAYFRRADRGAQPGEAYLRPPTLQVPNVQLGVPHMILPSSSAPVIAPSGLPAGDQLVPQSHLENLVEKHLNVQALIRSYQVRGHCLADLDPLGIAQKEIDQQALPGMTLEWYGLKEEDLDRIFKLPGITHIGGQSKELTLREILGRLKQVYCSNIGLEYMYINGLPMCDWVRRKFEVPGALELQPEERRLTLKRLIRSTRFESFLKKKWSSEKRFGIEGLEVIVPCLKTVIDIASARGVDSVIIGMAHRGRLNVLANVCRKPLDLIFAQFDSRLGAADTGSGDVKYHLGTCNERINRVTQRKLKIAVVANPSHLEAVNPVALGRAFAEQFYKADSKGEKVMCVLIHGDAAMSGQGVVYESIMLADLPAYTTHGTVHVVLNNQIGFTTDPRFSRSSPYCTDVARVVNAPIFHVNADAPEAVVAVSRVAAEWRCDWGKDVVIDLVGYRKHGHNEMDEPGFTQPLMYKVIRSMPSVLEKYGNKLVKEGIVTTEDIKKEEASYDAILEEAYAKAQTHTSILNRDWLDSPWDDFFRGKDPMTCAPTSVSEQTLEHIANKFSEEPSGFHLHHGIKRVLLQRRELAKARQADWAMGEAFAWGSLLMEKIHVRLSGQDVERGTFSHRHHVLHDQEVDKRTYIALNNLAPTQASYSVCNSSLSEYGVLGFEHGFSLTNPDALVIWEAQFGDFFNNAQCIVDQFLSGGQTKWVRQCGLVMLLPHGYEGMGPEHSSGRMERFLQASNDDADVMPKIDKNFEMQQLHETNWIVADVSTPANFFHMMRRQIKLPFRKPLIVLTPKSLLRLPEARSSFDEMIGDTRFRRVIPDSGPAAENPLGVKRLVFCTGRVYYEIVKQRARQKLEDHMAIARVEQISPFPYDLVLSEIVKYPNAELIWCQEEHKNFGAWTYVRPRFNTALEKLESGQVSLEALGPHGPEFKQGPSRRVRYIGRAVGASVAAGNKHMHHREENQFMSELMAI